LPTVVVTIENPNNRLTDAGVTVLQVAQTEGRPDPRAVVEALQADFDRRITERFGVASAGAMELNLMIEGGGQVAASFLAAGLVDQIEWFRAPIILGDEGRPAIGAFVLKDLAAAPRFRRLAVETVGDDLWERYGKA
jgi:diaminohydroxyphosphoribosylaminopyrimidine deaminase/5-amino-6-(5-phosphoribosylamino)uracil reductase